jgi:hypothetical protein
MTEPNDRKKRILRFIRESHSPLSIKQLSEVALGFSGKQAVGIIEGDVANLKVSGQIFEFPPDRAGRGPRFGLVSPADWLAARIIRLVNESGGRLTLKQVKGSLRQWETPYFDEAIGKAVKDERLFYLTVRYKYVLSSRPTPFDYLLPRQVTALKEILERVNRRRKTALALVDMRAFLDGAGASAVPTASASGLPTEDLLAEWYRVDVPRRGGLTSIPISWTWDRYESWCLASGLQPNLGEFQEFMRTLRRNGKIQLIPHSMTQMLSERELELSLRSQSGEVLYYWKWG